MTGNRDLYTITEDRTDATIADKDAIKNRLYQDTDIISILHNIELEGHAPDEYLNVNIFSHMYNPLIQHTVKNMIFFEVESSGSVDGNSVYTQKLLTFMILVDDSDLTTPYGCERHDLLAYLITDLFNWSNCLGTQISLTANHITNLDNKYCCRVMQFQSTATNGISPSRMNGVNNRFTGRNNAYD